MFELSLGRLFDAIWAVTFVVFSGFAVNGIASSAFSHRHDQRLDFVSLPALFQESSVAAITQPRHKDASIGNCIGRFVDAQHQLSTRSDVATVVINGGLTGIPLLGEPRAHWTTRV